MMVEMQTYMLEANEVQVGDTLTVYGTELDTAVVLTVGEIEFVYPQCGDRNAVKFLSDTGPGHILAWEDQPLWVERQVWA